MSNFTLKKDVITNPESALQYEWLETNGQGAYASSTVYDCNTRKYHGLLVAPIPEYGSRFVLLSKYLTKIIEKNKEFELPTCRYIGVYHPDGHKHIDQFSTAQGYPEVLYHMGSMKVSKAVMMIQNTNAVIVRYDVIEAEHPLTFQHTPLLAYREFHALQKQNFSINSTISKGKGYWSTTPYSGMPTLYFRTDAPTKMHPSPDWFLNLEYPKENSRGYDYHEDLFSPGILEYKLSKGERVFMLATIDKGLVASGAPDLESMWDEELRQRKRRHTQISKNTNSTLKNFPEYLNLKIAADKFIIGEKRANKPSIIAGFPWFGEWGRDTMISLPGLTCYNGDSELFIKILKTYLNDAQKGLIPNQFNSYGQSSYNSADASLLFFWSIQQYLEFHKFASKEKEKIKKDFSTAMQHIIDEFRHNKVPHVTCMPSGFLSVGDAYTQLTWMDANVHGKPVTPRHGYPVDINALWYNALKIYRELCFGDTHKDKNNKDITSKDKDGKEIDLLIKSIEKNFEDFYYCDEEYLYDTIIDNKKIDEIRPNQLLALGLPYSLIDKKKEAKILDFLTYQLFTNVGIRTLSLLDKNYSGVYHGNQEERDSKYHQGAAWPFLIGWYTDAFIKVNKSNKNKLVEYQQKLLSMVSHLVPTRGIGGLSELHDGDFPHEARGCPFQAWSVAETIRSIEKLQENI